MEDGHLTISAQRNKNLTFLLSGDNAHLNFNTLTPLVLPKGSSVDGGLSNEESAARGMSVN